MTVHVDFLVLHVLASKLVYLNEKPRGSSEGASSKCDVILRRDESGEPVRTEK